VVRGLHIFPWRKFHIFVSGTEVAERYPMRTILRGCFASAAAVKVIPALQVRTVGSPSLNKARPASTGSTAVACICRDDCSNFASSACWSSNKPLLMPCSLGLSAYHRQGQSGMDRRLRRCSEQSGRRTSLHDCHHCVLAHTQVTGDKPMGQAISMQAEHSSCLLVGWPLPDFPV
jgi:hypothetical protein